MTTPSITQIKQELTTLLRINGIVDVGFTCLAPNDIQELESNGLGVGSCIYGISIVAKLSDAIVDEISNAPTHTYFHHYRTVNTFLDQMTFRAGMYLEQYGYRYLTIAASQSINHNGWNFAGRYSHKHMACAAGLGTIGKSSMFLHHTFGPRVRLGSLLTDCPLETTIHTPVSLCGSCTLCTNACPSGAISGKEWKIGMARAELFSPEACSEHMKRAYQKIGRGAVCGICMRVCPFPAASHRLEKKTLPHSPKSP